MFDLDGECNGQNIYDVDWDEEYDNYSGGSLFHLPYDHFRWKTKEGKIYTLQQMTDKHLENSIKYEYKRKGRWTEACDKLHKELERRHDEKFFSQVKKCPFCDLHMIMTENQPEPEVGFSFPKYQFRCKCGAASNYIDREHYKCIIKG